MVSARLGDLVRGEEPLLGVLDLGQRDVAAGSAGDEPTVDGVVEDPSEELVGLADGGRGVAVGVKVRNPFLDVEDTDGADRHVGEDGQDEATQIRLVTGLGRVAAVHPPRGRLLGELTESDPSGPRVDVGAGEFAGLDGDEEPFGVDAATEVLRVLAAGRVAPPGLPRHAAGAVDDSTDRCHGQLPRCDSGPVSVMTMPDDPVAKVSVALQLDGHPPGNSTSADS